MSRRTFIPDCADCRRERIRRGTVVRDLRGKIRTVTKVVYSLAYELNGEPDKLYQPDEIRRYRGADRA